VVPTTIAPAIPATSAASRGTYLLSRKRHIAAFIAASAILKRERTLHGRENAHALTAGPGQVVNLGAQGLSRGPIAERLFCSKEAVKNRIYGKLGARHTGRDLVD